MRSAREAALQLLLDIETKGAYANLALAGLPETMPRRERHLATELVSGVTRMRRTLDSALDQISKHPMAGMKPALRNVLRLGAYQILFLDRIPERAAIHEAVAMARRVGHEGVAKLTNAILRKLAFNGWEGLTWPDDPAQRIAVRWSYPDWLIERWIAAYGVEDAEALARAEDKALQLTLRTNLCRTTREALLARLEDEGWGADTSPVTPEGVRLLEQAAVASLPGYEEGWWYVQGEGAMLAAAALDPRPGETIADVGAAPGGKSTHIAERMRDEGTVLAIEPHEGRLALVIQNAERLGLTCIRPVPRRAEEGVGTLVDRALVDAPCSGLGTLYRKADARWHVTPQEIRDLAALQGSILDAVAPSVKPGGVLVYSTCTIGREENEDVVAAFLGRHPEFRPGDLRFALPAEWRGEADDGMIQLLPHRHGTEGFFIARLDRASA